MQMLQMEEGPKLYIVLDKDLHRETAWRYAAMMNESKQVEIGRVGGIIDTYKNAMRDQKGPLRCSSQGIRRDSIFSERGLLSSMLKSTSWDREGQRYQDRQLWDETKALDEMRVAARSPSEGVAGGKEQLRRCWRKHGKHSR
jgi:hypothetical protein